ncbi:MAG: hypothetical protein MK209_06315 [Planctomycetes bacterium]|nr:hypothetical protein [Planctomycetota bacterium]
MSEALPRIHLPGCKSLSQRALLLAAVAEGESVLTGVSHCEDSTHLCEALTELGAEFAKGEDGQLLVRGMAGPPQGERHIDVGEAGSSLRFLLPLCAAGNGVFKITGTSRLISRPHTPLLDCLRSLGAQIDQIEHAGRPGFRVTSFGLPSGVWPVSSSTSSQYISGLSMAAAWSREVYLDLPAAVPSRGYFDMTLAVVEQFCGAEAWHEEVTAVGSRLTLSGQAPRAANFDVPGDPSGASFFVVALVLIQAAAELTPDWSSLHPEARLLVQLLEAGLLERAGKQWRATGFTPPEALRLKIDPAPDAGPALAVLGASLPHGLILEGVERLRAKESDRVLGMQRLSALCGREAALEGDQLILSGGGVIVNAEAARTPFDPDQDHRMAMAAGVARLLAPNISVQHPECVAKSFPNFWTEIAKLSPRGTV